MIMDKAITLCTLVALATVRAFALMPEVKNFRAPVQAPREVVKGFLWIEAEGFADYGAWRIDTQFVHKMGSAYLVAAGVLKPIGRATTAVDVPSAGVWTVWARTKDWLPEFHPGTFRVSVNGQTGNTLGQSGKEGWRWEKAGVWKLPAGRTMLALEDLSGSFARCDALVLTTEADYVPPDESAACAQERARLTGADTRIADGGTHDFVVVGAGPGGLAAALAAARHGVDVLLIHDRPILGGNASCELGVPTDGAAISHDNAREGGLCEEANLARVGTKERTLSAAFRQMAERLPNLKICYNSRVESAEKAGDKVATVTARDTLTGKQTRYRGKIFLDGTGDGWIGLFAGAELLYGREGRDKYNEPPAPEKGDEMLMSGCLMDNYLGYRYRATDRAVAYETPVWARVLPKGFVRRAYNGDSHWWVEHAGRFNEIVDPERGRDELIRINLAYWGWLKNEWKGKDTLATHELVEMAHMNGRREGYRILGDYILTGNDCQAGRMFDDRISYGGWPLDRHDPLGMENPTGNGYCEIHPNVPIYSIPFRVLYSKNVPNLMMAGRNVSVSHVALGSMRVEATIMTAGQAAGTAVAQMLKKGLLPREYGADAANIRALQQALLKDDQYIPGIVNEDPLDKARQATVTATSTLRERSLEELAPFRLAEKGHEINMSRAVGLARGERKVLEPFVCWFDSYVQRETRVMADIFSARDLSGKAGSMHKVGEATATVGPGVRGYVRFTPSGTVALAEAYVWVRLRTTRDVAWRLMRRDSVNGRVRAYGGGDWTVVPDACYAFDWLSDCRLQVDTKPQYVIDGVSRMVGSCTHGWISDPEQELPQSVTLSWSAPQEIREVRLTFDPDLTPLHPVAHPKTLVRAYLVEGQLPDGSWTKLAEAGENLLRHRVHGFASQKLTAVRVTVLSTWGDPSARIFEVRAY